MAMLVFPQFNAKKPAFSHSTTPGSKKKIPTHSKSWDIFGHTIKKYLQKFSESFNKIYW